jgi:CO/xanthine dehydrogenase Mo-binding subunit
MTIEIERYELVEDARYRFAFDRRDFLKTLGGGLLVLLAAPRLDGQESGRSQSRADALPADVNAWLHIAPSGEVTVFTGKTEVGQNIRTSLTQAVAEELHVPIASIVLVMADTARTPFDMGTFGSRTTPTMNAQLRRVAASARQVLIARAAEKWQVSADEVSVTEGKVTRRGSGEALSLADLVSEQPLVATVSADVKTIEPSAWHVAGTPVAKIDGRAFVTGRHQYTSDVSRPNMGHGRIVRPPRYGAGISAVDSAAAQAMAGVTVVRDGNFLGVVAPTTEAAGRAVAAITATWTGGDSQSGRTLFDDLRKTAEHDAGAGGYTAGDVDAAIGSASRTFDGSYSVAYIAHCPLEPRAAVAEWAGDALTVWTGTQRPFGVLGELAEAFHLPRERVRVIVPDTGSAYGG